MAGHFKKDWSKIASFNWYWHVINGRKGIRGGLCHSIYWYAKVNSKYMKDYDKNKNSKNLKVKGRMSLLQKLIRLLYVQRIRKECNQLI